MTLKATVVLIIGLIQQDKVRKEDEEKKREGMCSGRGCVCTVDRSRSSQVSRPPACGEN